MQEFIAEKIKANEEYIKQLAEENTKLKDTLQKNKGVKTIEKWIGYEFESSSGKTEEWKQFSKEFKKYIKDNLPENSELVNFNIEHFYVSGFVKRGDKYVYFSISDVRHFSDGWYNDILIRTVKDEKDYTGGRNSETDLKNFKEKVDYLLNMEE